MDLRVKGDYTVGNPAATDMGIEGADDAASNANIDEDIEFVDTTTFSESFHRQVRW